MAKIIKFPEKEIELNPENFEAIYFYKPDLKEIEQYLEDDETIGDWIAKAIAQQLFYAEAMKGHKKALKEYNAATSNI